jgi:hypothetical protein
MVASNFPGDVSKTHREERFAAGPYESLDGQQRPLFHVGLKKMRMRIVRYVNVVGNGTVLRAADTDSTVIPPVCPTDATETQSDPAAGDQRRRIT